MKTRTLLAAALGTAALLTLPLRAEEFKKLYNGKDLAGWHVTRGKLESWKANGEMISCVLPGGGYLSTDQEYGDFELKLEYRIGPRGNSGVGIRYPRGGWPSTMGMEIQILDDDHASYKGLKPEQRNGSVYTFAAPSALAHRPPGDWNKLEIRCKGPEVRIKLNGVEIQNISMDDFKQKGKGELPLSERPRKGLVGLQSHGDPVDFRGIEIREL